VPVLENALSVLAISESALSESGQN
jgi:hypothetical protein